MTARTVIDEPYLLDREAAAERYSMTLRELENVYRANPDFPIIRRGRRVLVHREQADSWFDQYVCGHIDVSME